MEREETAPVRSAAAGCANGDGDKDMDDEIKLVIVGSIGLDTIKTPFDEGTDLLGGSVSYACAAASFFGTVGMVGVVGEDFPGKYLSLYETLGIDTEGLQRKEGATFKWSGVYSDDMNERETISTELNVFASFMPDLPESYRKAPFVLLGNISPDLQLHVLDQVENPRFVVADTMDLWIKTEREKLMDVLGKTDMLMLNDGEARLLTGEYNLKRCAAKILESGPEYVVIKKGEHGALLFGGDKVFIVPGFLVENVYDPTGAGDSFAGAFMGFLAARGNTGSEALKLALLYGAVVASFGVEALSLDGFKTLDADRIEARLRELTNMIEVKGAG
ncbi:MAG: PfkB family carbohydrate kinase [Kiritimatiellia bacterium]